MPKLVAELSGIDDGAERRRVRVAAELRALRHTGFIVAIPIVGAGLALWLDGVAFTAFLFAPAPPSLGGVLVTTIVVWLFVTVLVSRPLVRHEIRRELWRLGKPVCMDCGYRLDPVGERCPECGARIPLAPP